LNYICNFVINYVIWRRVPPPNPKKRLFEEEGLTMTMPDERTRALVWAGELLRELTRHDLMPDVPENVREQARRVLRHYPMPSEIVSLALRDERSSGSMGPMLSSEEARKSEK
jgi:hypothetical protein